jgi:hypothetical protein
MRKLLILIVCIVLMVMAGWITINRSGDTTSLSFHKDEVKEDTKAAVEQGKELLDKVESEAKDLIPSKEADNR